MRRAPAILSIGILLQAVCLAEGPTFDAASVKITGPEVRQPYLITGGPGTNDPGRFHAPHIAMTTLLQRAFGLSTDQFKGPAVQQAFSAGLFYDVTATMPLDTTKEQFQSMLQNLLIERFHLVFHRENGTFPGYDLVVDKGGPKFKEVFPDPAVAAANPGAGAGASISMSFGRGGPDNFPEFPSVAGPRTMSQMANGKERTKYQERTMAEFVSNLGFVIGSSMGKPVTKGFQQPRVVDKTGLTGKYTFILEYSSEAGANLRNAFPAQSNPESPGAAPGAADDPGGGAPNIIVSIQKQLGLRLDKTADIPLEVIVVESFDKTPTAN